MIIETKYDLGNVVYSIKEVKAKHWESCTFCGGSDGSISRFEVSATKITGFDGTERRCPACRGEGGGWGYGDMTWVLDRVLTIGQVEVRAGYEDKETYMCEETGVGGGRLWGIDLLYPTEEGALAECAKRNESNEV